MQAMMEGTAQLTHGRNCPACGHHISEWENRCEKCGRKRSLPRAANRANAGVTPVAAASNLSRPASGGDSGRTRISPKIAPPPPAFPEHLRQQLQDRVQRYRSRHENRNLALPFEQELEPAPPVPAPKVILFPAPAIPVEEEIRVHRSKPIRESRPNQSTSEAPPQPTLDFHPAALREQVWMLRPVAPIRLRAAAHLKDLQLLAGAMMLFLAALLVIPYLGVTLHSNLMLLGGAVCGSLLMALLYGLLFVWGAGVTPGMRSAGLCLVTFDGIPAPRRQRLWRVFGAIVSAGSFFIGFLWAVVDEEKLYWHDHISKTYLTVSDR